MRFFIPAIIWFIISVILLTLPGSAFPQKNWMDDIWLDKWIHVGMFSIMVFLTCWAIYKSGSPANNFKRYFIIVGVLCLSYGIIMEFVQLWFVVNRSFDVEDIAADGAGSLLGTWYSIRRYIKK